MKDEWGIVLDFLKHGHAIQSRSVPVAQVLGEEHFNILEIIPRDDVILKSQDRVYIGAGKRDQVKSIIGRIEPSKLTATAHSELKFAIESLIDRNETKFIDFFNKAGPLTTKQHQLELLPSIGKKHMWQIIDERKKKPFESFEDLKKRVPLLPDPKKSVIKRIMDELDGMEKWYLFTSPPRTDEM
ncbi:MAG: DUF655 domain-containing protein [archaeon]